MDFPIHSDTISMGLPIMYLKGSPIEIAKLCCTSVPDGYFNLSKQSKTLVKCNIMLHFIWVVTVCQSADLGVSSIQRVNLEHGGSDLRSRGCRFKPHRRN